MNNLISKIKELRNNIKETDIQISSQEMKNHLKQLRSHVCLFTDQKLKEIAIELLNRIEKTNDLKMQIVMLNLWKEIIKDLVELKFN